MKHILEISDEVQWTSPHGFRIGAKVLEVDGHDDDLVRIELTQASGKLYPIGLELLVRKTELVGVEPRRKTLVPDKSLSLDIEEIAVSYSPVRKLVKMMAETVDHEHLVLKFSSVKAARKLRDELDAVLTDHSLKYPEL